MCVCLRLSVGVGRLMCVCVFVHAEGWRWVGEVEVPTSEDFRCGGAVRLGSAPAAGSGSCWDRRCQQAGSESIGPARRERLSPLGLRAGAEIRKRRGRRRAKAHRARPSPVLEHLPPRRVLTRQITSTPVPLILLLLIISLSVLC